MKRIMQLLFCVVLIFSLAGFVQAQQHEDQMRLPQTQPFKYQKPAPQPQRPVTPLPVNTDLVSVKFGDNLGNFTVEITSSGREVYRASSGTLTRVYFSLPAGRYNLTASKTGYEVYTTTFTKEMGVIKKVECLARLIILSGAPSPSGDSERVTIYVPGGCTGSDPANFASVYVRTEDTMRVWRRNVSLVVVTSGDSPTACQAVFSLPDGLYSLVVWQEGKIPYKRDLIKLGEYAETVTLNNYSRYICEAGRYEATGSAEEDICSGDERFYSVLVAQMVVYEPYRAESVGYVGGAEIISLFKRTGTGVTVYEYEAAADSEGQADFTLPNVSSTFGGYSYWVYKDGYFPENVDLRGGISAGGGPAYINIQAVTEP